MFSNNKKEASKAKGNLSMSTSPSNSINRLEHGTVIEGTVRAKGDIRVDGTIQGKLFCEAKVFIGPTGKVKGEIKCQNAVIEGHFEGNLNVAELLSIKDSANINGEVITNKLVVQSGAVFNVSCTMGGVKQSGSNGSLSSSSKSSTVEKTGKVVKETRTADAKV